MDDSGSYMYKGKHSSVALIKTDQAPFIAKKERRVVKITQQKLQYVLEVTNPFGKTYSDRVIDKLWAWEEIKRICSPRSHKSTKQLKYRFH